MIKFQKMSIYKLLRNPKLDHEFGRPVIFLDFLGQESLIWFGTSLKNENNEIPLIIKINGLNTYFYNKGIMKVPTMKLIGKWRNNSNQKIISLTSKEQQKLIAKFSTLTLQPNPYLTINELKENNEYLIDFLQTLLAFHLFSRIVITIRVLIFPNTIIHRNIQ